MPLMAILLEIFLVTLLVPLMAILLEFFLGDIVGAFDGVIVGVICW